MTGFARSKLAKCNWGISRANGEEKPTEVDMRAHYDSLRERAILVLELDPAVSVSTFPLTKHFQWQSLRKVNRRLRFQLRGVQLLLFLYSHALFWRYGQWPIHALFAGLVTEGARRPPVQLLVVHVLKFPFALGS